MECYCICADGADSLHAAVFACTRTLIEGRYVLDMSDTSSASWCSEVAQDTPRRYLTISWNTCQLLISILYLNSFSVARQLETSLILHSDVTSRR